MRAFALLAQHAEGVSDGVRAIGEILMDLHLVGERDQRGFAGIGGHQLGKQDAAGAQLIDDGAGIGSRLDRDDK